MADEPTTKKEIWGWNMVDGSNSLYATVGIGGFLLLQIQYSALAAAGYPEVCPNVITNTTLLRSIFNDTSVTSAFFLGSDTKLPGSSCPSKVKIPCVNGLCPGLPSTVSECRDPSGSSQYKLSISGTSTDPTGFATLCLAFSVLVQVVVFVAFASAADYSNNRKRMIVWSGIVGGVGSILCFLITPSLWWIGMPLTILTNVAYGMSSVGYNSYLPLLVRAKPEVQAAVRKRKGLPALEDQADGASGRTTTAAWGDVPASPSAVNTSSAIVPVSSSPTAASAAAVPSKGNTSTAAAVPGAAAEEEESLEELELRVGSEISNVGFIWGYIAGIIGIILCAPFSFFLPELGGYQAALVITGVWWLMFGIFPARWLKNRPGPPLPRGKPGRNCATALIVESASTQWRVLKGIRGLPVTWKYLVLWALFSDAVFLIGSIGGLFAASEVDWGCMSKGIGILLMFILVPIFAMLGNFSYMWVQRRFHVKTKSLLLFSLATAALAPIWGLVGLAPGTTVGMKNGWECLVLACVYGTCIGSMQSYSRATFAALVPKGQEAGLFGLYELTNKGSSALGPLVLTLIQQLTGQLRYGFIFVVVCIVIPALFVWRLDVEQGARDAAALMGPSAPASAAPSSPPSRSDSDIALNTGKGGAIALAPMSNPIRAVGAAGVSDGHAEAAANPSHIVRRSSLPFAVAVAAGAPVHIPPGQVTGTTSTVEHLAPTTSAAAVFVAAHPPAVASEGADDPAGPGAVVVQRFPSGNTSADQGFGRELAALHDKQQ